MAQKLSRYAVKVRQGICPTRYGSADARNANPLSAEDAKRYEAEAFYKAARMQGWRAPLVRIVRHQGIIKGKRRLIPLTAAELRATH